MGDKLWKNVMVFIFVYKHLLSGVHSGAVFSMEFLTFDNNGDMEWNGKCCDMFCFGACDPIFTLCLDGAQGDQSFTSCAYFRAITGGFDNTNIVVFGSKIGNVANPIVLRFDSWPGAIKLKVLAKDDDSVNQDDEMDKFFKTFTVTPHRSLGQAQKVQYSVYGERTSAKPARLDLSIQLYCTDNFYGPQCDVECYGRDDDLGHFLCDPNTGQPLCRPGWEKPTTNCTVPADECIKLNITCQNGGTCLDGFLNYTCLCAEGYFGEFCEQNVCDNTTCENGGTCVGAGQCSCLQGFYGDSCQNKTETQPLFPIWAFGTIGGIAAFIILDLIIGACIRCRRKKCPEKSRLVHYNPTYDEIEYDPVLDHAGAYSNGNVNNIYTIGGPKSDDYQNSIYDVPEDMYAHRPVPRLVLNDGAFPDEMHVGRTGSVTSSSTSSSLSPSSDRKPFVREYDTTFTEWVKGSIKNTFTRHKS